MTPVRRFFRASRALGLAALLLALVAGCQSRFGATSSQSASAGATSSATAQIPLGRSTRTMTVDGTQRTVHLYRPSGLTAGVPLVVMLHGGYGNGVQAETSYHWDPEADAGHSARSAAWRANDHCAAPAITAKGVLTTSIASCPNGKAVELITIAGAGHGWPGGDKNPKEEAFFHTGPPSTALNATQVIWQFFAAHPK